MVKLGALVQLVYHWLLHRTTNRPWTFIMRDNPRYLWVPGTAMEVAIGIGLVMIYGVPWWLVAPAMVLRKFYNYLSGHVFWGRKNPKVEAWHEHGPLSC